MDLAYAYAAPSVFERTEEGAGLSLATSGGSTLGGATAHPFFFAGFVEFPESVAAALLVVARVARTRFYVPPNMLAAILRAADPVVTATAEGLRLESFSACCGVYARLDVDAAALDVEHLSPGVTNVDVNPPLRQALAGVRAGEPLRLTVGDDELRVATLDDEVVEERVPLPDRWLKGFAEAQYLSSGMTSHHELDANTTARFVRSLPRTSTTRSISWATASSRGVRLASRPSPGAVCVAGPERLRVLEPMLRLGSSLTAYGPAVDTSTASAASVWTLEIPGGRLSIALSPDKSRGFSGEGAVLPLLAGPSVSDDADLMSATLAFEPRIDVERLVTDTGLPTERVRAALAVLASSGQVGFDLHNRRYFHRPLPVRADALSVLHPRLRDARALTDAGAVSSADDGTFGVRSGTNDYVVRQLADGYSCTCPWYAKYRGTRGPCKHVLAVMTA